MENTIEMEKIHFGPHLVKTKVSNEILTQLIDISKNANTAMNNNLAGQIDYEMTFEHDDYNRIFDLLQPYFVQYLNMWTQYKFQENVNAELNLNATWINKQIYNEFNPMHNHTGDISFVIYLNIPHELYIETNTTKSMPYGAIEFMYNKDNSVFSYNHLLDPIVNYVKVPKTGDMFIFPSSLFHHVQKFNTPNVERISLAGNLIIKNI